MWNPAPLGLCRTRPITQPCEAPHGGAERRAYLGVRRVGRLAGLRENGRVLSVQQRPNPAAARATARVPQGASGRSTQHPRGSRPDRVRTSRAAVWGRRDSRMASTHLRTPLRIREWRSETEPASRPIGEMLDLCIMGGPSLGAREV